VTNHLIRLEGEGPTLCNKNTCYSILFFSIILGILLRFYKIGEQPLWLDEAYSYWFSTRSIKELWITVPRYETNPPLYYTILKVWGLFGSSESWLRSLSAIMSIGCIPLVFMLGRLLGKPIGGEWIGAAAASMFAVSPVHIQYAQEARAYAMLTFFATMTLCAILWVMRHPGDACVPLFAKGSNLKNREKYIIGWAPLLCWITIIFGTIFTLYMHNTSVLYVLTLTLVIIAWFVKDLKFNYYFLANSLIACLMVFLFWGPYLIFIFHQTRLIIKAFPISPPNILSTMNSIFFLLIGKGLGYNGAVKLIMKIGIFLVVTILAGVGLWNIRRHCGVYVSILILCSIIGPILLELIFSVTITPIFVDRTLIYISVPFYVSIGAGLMTLRDLKKRILLFIIIIFAFLYGTTNYYRDNQKEPWNEIVHLVTNQSKLEDIVLLVPNNLEPPFSYYAKNYNKKPEIVPFPYSFPGSEGVITFNDIPKINRLTANKISVWVITRREDPFDPNRIVINLLLNQRELISKWHFQGGIITVYKFM